MDNEKAPWALQRSEAEQRRVDTELGYELEMEFRKVGWGDPALVYDEEKGLFRFVDGKFAFSSEHTDWMLLRKGAVWNDPELKDLFILPGFSAALFVFEPVLVLLTIGHGGVFK